MTTSEAIQELTDWLKLMDYVPDVSTPIEDAVIEAIDALKAVQRASAPSPSAVQELEALIGVIKKQWERASQLEEAAQSQGKFKAASTHRATMSALTYALDQIDARLSRLAHQEGK